MLRTPQITFPTVAAGSRSPMPLPYRRDMRMILAVAAGALLVLAGSALIITAAVIL